MTENEAIEELKYDCNEIGKAIPCDTSWGESFENAYAMAINALEEVQQYRTIGKPMEIKQKLEELERWHTYRLAENVKNPFAKMSTSICHNCDHKDDYIEELEAEVKEYRAIGTVEECRAAVENQTAKKPDYEGDGYADGHLVYDTWICPCCGKHYEVDYDNYNYCPDCGQKLDWSDENEVN